LDRDSSSIKSLCASTLSKDIALFDTGDGGQEGTGMKHWENDGRNTGNKNNGKPMAIIFSLEHMPV
tara:strand:- start:363 stop:560 length:198 start_codon:yes stop_codon:yes gene_type:complete